MKIRNNKTYTKQIYAKIIQSAIMVINAHLLMVKVNSDVFNFRKETVKLDRIVRNCTSYPPKILISPSKILISPSKILISHLIPQLFKVIKAAKTTLNNFNNCKET